MGGYFMRLETISWAIAKEYFERKDIVVLPVGSIENHGAHLALGTDYLVPVKLVEMLEKRLDVLFAPALPYGNADNHMSFPGTVSLGEEGLYQTVKSIVMSLYNHGARKVVFLNGHGGNINALSRVGIDLNRKGGLSAILNWWLITPALNEKWAGGHAGAHEASTVMAINENYVYLDRAEDTELINLSENLISNNLNGVFYKNINIPVPRFTENITKTGWAGSDHPKEANAQWGQDMLNGLCDFYADFIEEFEKIKL
jgi:creatinine amidohydrolase